MATTTPNFPVRDALTGGDGLISRAWAVWFRDSVLGALIAAPFRYSAEVLTNQNASIGTTALPTPSLSAGRYRVSVTAAIQVAAAVSSSVTVTIFWTEDGLTKSFAFAVMNGNTTTTVLVSPPITINLDAGTPISYSTTYASNPAAAATYKLAIEVERINA